MWETSGTLAPGATTEIYVYNAHVTACSLEPGIYSGVICFTNQTTHNVVANRFAQLTVRGPDRLEVRPAPGPTVACYPFQVTITALDELGMVVTKYSDTVSLSARDGTGAPIPVTPTSAGPFENGRWTGNVVIPQLVRRPGCDCHIADHGGCGKRPMGWSVLTLHLCLYSYELRI